MHHLKLQVSGCNFITLLQCAGTSCSDRPLKTCAFAGEGSAAAAGELDAFAPNEPEFTAMDTQASPEHNATARSEERSTAGAAQDTTGPSGAPARTTDDDEMVDRNHAVPEGSEISKMEESDIDDVEEAAGGKAPGKDRSTVDEDEDDDDALRAPPVNGLVSSPSVLPLDFEVIFLYIYRFRSCRFVDACCLCNVTYSVSTCSYYMCALAEFEVLQGGKGSSAVEPCPVCAQPQAELAPLSLPGEPDPEEVQELYCNEAMYGFWRLYHHCYDRLRIARNCILEKHGRNGKDMVCSITALVALMFAVVIMPEMDEEAGGKSKNGYRWAVMVTSQRGHRMPHISQQL